MKRFKELDALRGIAALSVVLFHYFRMTGTELLPLKLGVTGVDLFFLISGFVIFMTLERTKTPMDFVVSRVSRLYPAYFIFMFLTIAVVGIFGNVIFSTKDILFNLTMLQPWFHVPYIDDSYWTLTVEMQFYIFMLIIFITGRLKHIELIGVITLAVLMSYYFVVSVFITKGPVRVLPRALFPFISHFQLFFAGILFYRMRTTGVRAYHHLLIAIVFIYTLLIFNKTGRAHMFMGLLPYAICLLVYFLVFYLFTLDKLTFMNTPVLSWLGAISYSMYLFHQEIGRVLYKYFHTLHGMPDIVCIPLLLLLVFGVSTAVTYLIERPCIRFIRERWEKPKNVLTPSI